MKIQPIIHNTLSMLLGTVFIVSSVTKFISLDVFGTEVLLYLEVYFGGWLSDYGIYVAGAVCMAELLTGIACLLPRFRWLGNAFAFSSLTFFVYLTGDNYFHPSVIGRIETCGCFGELIHFTPLWSFVKSLVLWIVAITCISMYVWAVARQEN